MGSRMQEHSHQRHRQHAKHHKAVGDDPPGLVDLALSHAHAHQRRATHADQRGGRPYQRDHRPAYAHARQRQAAHLRNVADIHAIDDAVEHADKLCQHAGQRDPQHQPSDGIPPQVVFPPHVCAPLSNADCSKRAMIPHLPQEAQAVFICPRARPEYAGISARAGGSPTAAASRSQGCAPPRSVPHHVPRQSAPYG